MHLHTNLFIVGTQRSGTTLLRLILNAHPEIAIPEEAAFLRPMLTSRHCRGVIKDGAYNKLISYFIKNRQYKLWNYDSTPFVEFLEARESISVKELISELFSSYSISEGKSIWGDKTPVFWRKIRILSSLFPEALFIHIVRDGRDVFDSWRKMDQTKNNVAVTAMDWCLKLFKIEQAFKGIKNEHKILIRYEDLIDQPEKTIRKVCQKIGVGFDVRMLKFYTSSEKYIGDHHSSLIFKPMDRSNKEKWKKNLSEQEVRIYNLIGSNFLKKYGYGVDGRSHNINDYWQTMKHLILGVPQKSIQVFSAAKSMETAFKKGVAPDVKTIGNMPAHGFKNTKG